MIAKLLRLDLATWEQLLMESAEQLNINTRKKIFTQYPWIPVLRFLVILLALAGILWGIRIVVWRRRGGKATR